MKRNASLRSSRCLLLVGSLALLNLTVTAAEKSESSAASAATAKIPAEILLTEIKATPYTQRAALREKLKIAEAGFDDRLAEWEARKNALPEEEKVAAEADFKQLVWQREILRQKIAAVDRAEEATWNAATGELHAMLQDAITTYRKLSARFSN